jgi:hypothetical protein
MQAALITEPVGFSNVPGKRCDCPECESGRKIRLLDDLSLAYGVKTVDQIIAECAMLTDEQRSLAYSPEPPYESAGAGSCFRGGNCGLDLNAESRRAKWVRARHRVRRAERLGGVA